MGWLITRYGKFAKQVCYASLVVLLGLVRLHAACILTCPPSPSHSCLLPHMVRSSTSKYPIQPHIAHLPQLQVPLLRLQLLQWRPRRPTAGLQSPALWLQPTRPRSCV